MWWSQMVKLKTPFDKVQRLYYTHLGISSYAKIASDLTTEVGCAIVHCGTSYNAVCHYKTDLADGRKLYEAGPRCSGCPGGIKSCYIGLCT
ncbi:hypothetical protein OESDEN_04333 [Oesophagostomum dentatum]|uniref:Uncharacterized protein n=1 Tax=Oesophagostomum dentatum TaxID=61180 RepID=A0A0B1TDW2_OESDE|nr:hypothetical protein OESDEN_04333 [Oesophagostomum dentatum]